MTRPWIQIHRAATIVLGPLILIPHHHGNRRAKRQPEFRTRLDLNAVLLVAGRRQRRLPWSSARHLWLDVGFGEREAGRHAVDDASDATAVRFAVGRDPEIGAEAGHGCWGKERVLSFQEEM